MHLGTAQQRRYPALRHETWRLHHDHRHAWLRQRRFEATYAGAGITISAHETLDGLRLEIGVRVNVGRKLYAKAEYRYTNYEQGVSRDQGFAGIGLKF
jgi:opacity protein-like surface antigen